MRERSARNLAYDRWLADLPEDYPTDIPAYAASCAFYAGYDARDREVRRLEQRLTIAIQALQEIVDPKRDTVDYCQVQAGMALEDIEQ